jgi:hypothetical protein
MAPALENSIFAFPVGYAAPLQLRSLVAEHKLTIANPNYRLDPATATLN